MAAPGPVAPSLYRKKETMDILCLLMVETMPDISEYNLAFQLESIF